MGKEGPDYGPFTTCINDRFIDKSLLPQGGNEPLVNKNSQCRFTATPPPSMTQEQICTQFDDRGQPLGRQTANFQGKSLKGAMTEHDKEGTEIFTSITIEYLVNGLQDPDLLYDVMSKTSTSN